MKIFKKKIVKAKVKTKLPVKPKETPVPTILASKPALTSTPTPMSTPTPKPTLTPAPILTPTPIPATKSAPVSDHEKIIGRETMSDGRVLEYGARDPETGKRFERIIMPKDLPEFGIVKVVDVNGHILAFPSMEVAQAYIKTSGGKLLT